MCVCGCISMHLCIYCQSKGILEHRVSFFQDHSCRHLPARMSLVKPAGLMGTPILPLCNRLSIQRPLTARVARVAAAAVLSVQREQGLQTRKTASRPSNLPVRALGTPGALSGQLGGRGKAVSWAFGEGLLEAAEGTVPWRAIALGGFGAVCGSKNKRGRAACP